jgi:hypothetical protein
MACAVDPRSGPVAAVRNPVGCSSHRTGSSRNRAAPSSNAPAAPAPPSVAPAPPSAAPASAPVSTPRRDARGAPPSSDHDIHRHEGWCIQCLSWRVTPRRADCDVGRPQFAGTERFQGRTALTAVFPLGRSTAALGTSPCSIWPLEPVSPGTLISTAHPLWSSS